MDPIPTQASEILPSEESQINEPEKLGHESSDSDDDLSSYKEYKAGLREFSNVINKFGGEQKSHGSKTMMLFMNFKNEGSKVLKRRPKILKRKTGGKIEKPIENKPKFNIQEALEYKETETESQGEYYNIND